jgi:hypothetical protein
VGGWLAALVGAGLLAIHVPRMIPESHLYDFPNQRLTFPGLARVRDICLKEGITAKQAVAALDPMHPHWMPMERREANVIRLIGRIDLPSRVPDDQVRAVLLAGLTDLDREGLFGNMDVGPYLTAASTLERADAIAVEMTPGNQRLVQPTGIDHQFETKGWPSYLEFTLPNAPEPIAKARWLIVPVIAPSNEVEVWWDDGNDHWTEGRSVRWRPSVSRAAGIRWAVPLDRLPHWDGRTVRRVRVMFRFPGTVSVLPPRLVL